MKRIALFAVIIGLALTEGALAENACTLTAADKAANAKLSYKDFDQTGTLPSSARALDRAGCDAAAAEANEDYMLHREGLTNGERINVLFHEGQSLAKAGDERGAARLIAATRNLTQKADDPFDWNTYVEGTWAFLVKDRARLEAASAKLSAQPGVGNETNAKVLRGLLRCFSKPYKEAYGTVCRKE